MCCKAALKANKGHSHIKALLAVLRFPLKDKEQTELLPCTGTQPRLSLCVPAFANWAPFKAKPDLKGSAERLVGIIGTIFMLNYRTNCQQCLTSTSSGQLFEKPPAKSLLSTATNGI